MSGKAKTFFSNKAQYSNGKSHDPLSQRVGRHARKPHLNLMRLFDFKMHLAHFSSTEIS